MSAEGIASILLLIIFVGVIGTILCIAPERIPQEEVSFSQSLADPAFKQWETQYGYRVQSVEVRDNGTATVRFMKERK